MLRPLRSLLPVLACLATGCDPHDLYKVSDHGPGIPFYPLVSVNREVRTFEQCWMRIDVTVRKALVLRSGKKGDDSTQILETSDSFAFFALGEQKDNERTLRKLAESLAGVSSWEKVNKVLGELGQTSYRQEPGPITIAAPSDLPAEGTRSILGLVLAGIARSVEAMPATQPKYVNVSAPAYGSSSAEIRLSERGTLAPAALAPHDPVTTSTSAEPGISREPARSPFPGLLDETRPPIVTGVTIATTAAKRTYLVTYRWQTKDAPADAAPSFADHGPNPCLQAASFSGPQCVVDVAVSNP